MTVTTGINTRTEIVKLKFHFDIINDGQDPRTFNLGVDQAAFDIYGIYAMIYYGYLGAHFAGEGDSGSAFLDAGSASIEEMRYNSPLDVVVVLGPATVAVLAAARAVLALFDTANKSRLLHAETNYQVELKRQMLDELKAKGLPDRGSDDYPSELSENLEYAANTVLRLDSVQFTTE